MRVGTILQGKIGVEASPGKRMARLNRHELSIGFHFIHNRGKETNVCILGQVVPPPPGLPAPVLAAEVKTVSTSSILQV